MLNHSEKEIWLVTGSQHLYGPEVLKEVENHSSTIVRYLNENEALVVPLRMHGVVATPEEILKVCLEANADLKCIGIIIWMHTFSPAKMWIKGLSLLSKPLCHIHTQFNDEIPWEGIDMDFMNLNQSAHGDRELGFLMSRMRKNRKIVVGHWKSLRVHQKLHIWSRVCLGWHEWQTLKVARIGDNMREVAVTEGDKVEAQMRLGFSVNGYDSSDVLQFIEGIPKEALKELLESYEVQYTLDASLRKGGERRQSLVEAAKIEYALSSFLQEGGFGAFTDTFENLGNFAQLPGIAVQRLMAQGYGFGAEGDWKTAALLRAMKVMAQALEGGTSFMEDYTYHFSQEKSYVLGSHMLEICPTIASHKPFCEVHPLGIGGKADPVRLVFDSQPGPAINASLVDLGNRFRLIVSEVESVTSKKKLPKLPVARVLWDAKPNLEIAATAWMLAGGAHHTVYTQALTTAYMEDFADIAGIEFLVIDEDTKIRNFKDTLRVNEVYYHIFSNQ